MRKLKLLGFDDLHSGGKHQYMKKGDEKIFIPNPHKGDIGVPIISQIIKQLKISKEKFENL